ncbi:hypothetical protein B566_EDAN008175 [Ephemera danica]|nr:hypothetical protein B566_EDAN008175 [Ephemera danica]
MLDNDQLRHRLRAELNVAADIGGDEGDLLFDDGPPAQGERYAKLLDGARRQMRAAIVRQQEIELNWCTNPITQPKILMGHAGHTITSLHFSGNHIISGSDDKTLRVWSATTYEVRISHALCYNQSNQSKFEIN